MLTCVLIESPVGTVVIKAKFVGWLADLVGHKELTEWKDHGGRICCMEVAIWRSKWLATLQPQPASSY